MAAMYHVEINNNGDSIMNAKSGNYEFAIDTKGKGITPPDALLASLASCLGVYINKYFEGAKIASGGFKITADADFAQEKPACFKAIKVSVELKGVELDVKRKQALLAFAKNCPVHNTLKANPTVEISL